MAFDSSAPTPYESHALLYRLVFALISKYRGQIAELFPRLMLFTQYRLDQPKFLSMYLFCLLVLALITQ
jgi:hypothetical protein